MKDEFRVNGQMQFRCNSQDGPPARDGVRTGGRPAEKSDVSMAEIEEMLQDELCGAMVIEDDVGDVRDMLMAGDGHGGKSGFLVDGGVNGNDAFSAAGEKQLGIGTLEVVVMAVGDGEEEEVVLAENSFDATDDGRSVGVADFLGDHADGVAALYTERACEEIRAIVELASGLDDTVAGFFGDGA